MNIGIFGGSFNPIHYGHIYIANCFTSKCNLDKCLFIPAYISPFKSQDNDIFYDIHQRLETVKHEIANWNEKFEICDYEIKNETISYTFDTLLFIRNKYANAKLFLLIGTDQALRFSEWKNYQEILKIAKIAIASRQGSCDKNEQILINSVIFPYQPIWLENNIIPISSTEIRNNKNSLII